ncbi:lipopolysaccharide-binding protein-like [Dasypus novemcinctus]|uniref:lipopolysaccharide-binding protein-like n=1 Tax=Dasypus novemcinctus TaxID=9361 RepID=UPI00265F463C|nr:lipopolysaccharide-binding protein-like [Dasypus novemcinctus]
MSKEIAWEKAQENFLGKELRTKMIARLYCVVVALLLLAEVSSFGEDNSDAGIIARITKKGLKYARHHGVANLKKEFSKLELRNFTGKFKNSWIGSIHYEVHNLKINHFILRNSNLSLLPLHGVRVSLSNNQVSVYGMWKVKKTFFPAMGTFNMSLGHISISFSLNVSKDQSGQPTASVAHCKNTVGKINIDLSKNIRWIKKHFLDIIKKRTIKILDKKVNKWMSRFVVSTSLVCT